MPIEPDPVFTMTYSVNNVQGHIQAGKEDYYMYTYSEKDAFNIDQLKGELRDGNTNKTNAFEFSFRSNSKTDVDLDSLFSLGQKAISDSNLHQASNTRVKLSLDARETQNVIKYNWTVNTILSSNLKNPSFIFDSNEDDNFPVALQTFFDTSCVATTQRCVEFSNTSCFADFDFTVTNTLEYTFSIPPYLEDDVQSVIWYVNNQITGTGKQVTHNFPSQGNYFISVDVFFKDGCASCISRRLTVNSGNSYNGCVADFDMEFTTYNTARYLQLNTLEIKYWDDSGVLYSSINSLNPGTVEILEASDYKANETGLPTKKVRLKGVVTLTSNQGAEILLDIEEANIAVGIQP